MSSESPPRQSLWARAFKALSPEDKDRLQKYHAEKEENAASIDGALREIQEKQQKCLQKRWVLKTMKGRIIVRDVLDKIAFWANKFKEVGDTAVQFDTSHASLPWAGVRFLLQLSINDLQTFASVAEGLETLARLTSRYTVFEAAYLPALGQELTSTQSKLCEALVPLYSDCLRFLADIGKYYERSTGERIARSLYSLSDRVSNSLNAIAVKEAEVERLAQIVQTECARQLDASVGTLQEQNRASFKSLEALFHSFKGPLTRLSDPLVLFHSTLESKQRRKLLLWLSVDNYREHHESTYKDVVPDTAQWIFSKPQYREWQLSSACSTLWLHGMPGCGKTKLTATVIQQHLDETRKSDQSAPIAHVYCSTTTRTSFLLDSTMVLRSIVRQLAMCQSGQKIRQPLWEEYNRRQEAANVDGLDPSPLTMEECTQMLLAMTLDCPATIIIDGIDELDGQRLDLLASIRTLIGESSSIVKILISSREDTDIAQALHDALSVRVSSNENSTDIEKFVRYRTTSAIASQKLLGGSVSELLKSHLISALLEGAGGMFLWPALQLAYFCDRQIFKVEADIMRALKTLPPTMVGTFERLYARINSYGKHGKTIATRVFAWLLAAERALSVSELVCAIRLREEDLDGECMTQMVYSTQTILDLCCNFVVLDENSGQFSFVHASVREYLQLLPEYSVSMNNYTVAKRCLEYFMSDEEDVTQARSISSQGSSPPSSSDVDNGLDPFREYAICHWAHHFLKTTDTKMKLKLDIIMKQFISEEEAMTFGQWLQDVKDLVELKRPQPSHLKELNAILNDSGSPMFVACVYGIPTILEHIESEALRTGKTVDYNAKNAHGASALYVCARYGHTVSLQFLLHRRANTDATGGFFGNPLQASAFHGHQDVVHILAEENANLFAPGKFTSALDAAMAGGNEQVIKSLLEASNITSKTELEKVLSRASYDGHDEVVRHILDLLMPRENDNCNSADNASLHNALQMALFQGRTRLVKRMLKDITDINLNTGHFGNALQAAAFGGHAMMVIMVLERKASVNYLGRYGTALRAAALRGHDAIVRLLIDKGASIQGRNADAMQAAASKGHFSTVKLLLDSGIYDDRRFRLFELLPAIKAACFKGYMDIAKLFLQRYGSQAAFTVFGAALDGGHNTITRLALEYEPRLLESERPDGSEGYCSAGGSLSLLPSSLRHVRRYSRVYCTHDEASEGEACDIASSKFDGRLPWLELTKEDVLAQDSFWTKNDDINAGNGRFLRIAARHGYGDIIENLLAQGFDINTTGNSEGPRSGQSTPIEVAAAAGQAYAVGLLLSKGARVGRALSYAVRNRHLHVIRLLFQERPDLPVDEPVCQDRANYCGSSKSAISVAVAWNFPDILDLLVGHARMNSNVAVGQGLVQAAKKRDLNLCRLILRGFTDSDATLPEHYDALFQTTRQAAHKQDMCLMRLLLDHAASGSTGERLLSEFIREGIVRDDWYTVLWDVKEAFAPPFYDRLQSKALLAIASKKQSRHSNKKKSAVVEQFQQLCNSYPMCVSSYPEALIEAAKSGNADIIHFLLRGQPPGCQIWAQCQKIPWVNHSDGHGNTALYYACTGGHPNVFHALIEAGADPYTHQLRCQSQINSATNERPADEREKRVNLLQIALDARMADTRGTRSSYTWELPLRTTWGPIVLYLLEIGLEVDLKSPSLVKFFHISCYQGELAYVEKLLTKGISLVGEALNYNSEDRLSFGSALHVAAAAGKNDVAKCLLNSGADVRLKADFWNGYDVEHQTAVKTAIEGRRIWLSRSKSAVLETCAYLVESGTADSDAEIVLREACECQNLEIVGRMVRHGARVQNVPAKGFKDYVDLYRVLSECGYDLHSQPKFISKIQENAIKRGDVGLLARLVDNYGLQIRFDVFVDCAAAIIWCEGDRRAVLRYLIHEMSFDINAPYHYYPGSGHRDTILCQAALAHQVDVVELLLQEGANPDSPGLRCTPLWALLCDSIGYSQCYPIARIVKVLLEYGADVHGARESDRELDGRLKPKFKTVLVLAIWWRSSSALEVVKLLIEHGADINHGEVTPFQLARYFGAPEFESLLLQHGAADHGEPTRHIACYVDQLRKNDVRFL